VNPMDNYELLGPAIANRAQISERLKLWVKP
jgi:hypothetical protein